MQLTDAEMGSPQRVHAHLVRFSRRTSHGTAAAASTAATSIRGSNAGARVHTNDFCADAGSASASRVGCVAAAKRQLFCGVLLSKWKAMVLPAVYKVLALAWCLS